ncbi:hydrogenase expression/formation protein [Candidatus Parcubacteria bacterium]|nr:hydrogenase expression/formation protein [Candidatus Parcubacteria bacterium]
MEPGKILPNLLEQLLKRLQIRDKRIILGPALGEDSAVIRFGQKFLALTTDPITLTSKEIGWYVVHINANDIATRGATPKWFLVTLLLPQKIKKSQIEEIFAQIERACQELNVSLVGGHTEILAQIENPIAVGMMVGEGSGNFCATKNLKPGDLILLTKGIAIEGTAILAREKEKELKSRGYKKELIEKAKNFIFDPGISVVKEALLAKKFGAKAMHDITEGGILNGLWEMAKASGVNIEIEKEKIPIFKETEILCQEFNLNPLALISSGALLIGARDKVAQKLVGRLQREKIKVAIIGKAKSKSKKPQIIIKSNKKIQILRAPKREQLNKI